MNFNEFQKTIEHEVFLSEIELENRDADNETKKEREKFKDKIQGLEPISISKRNLELGQYQPKGITKFSEKDLKEYESKLSGNSLGCQGIHILAFYAPFHIHNKWGIYIKLQGGIGYLARKFLDYSEEIGFGLKEKEAKSLAYSKLMIHEQGHYAIERLFTSFENDGTQNEKYKPYSSKKKNTTAIKDYEEAFCNALVERSKILNVRRPDHGGINKEIKITKNISGKYYVRKFMDNQSEGYREYKKLIKRNFFANTINELTKSISTIEPKKKIEEASIRFKKDLIKQSWKDIPTYLIDDTKQFEKIYGK